MQPLDRPAVPQPSHECLFGSDDGVVATVLTNDAGGEAVCSSLEKRVLERVLGVAIAPEAPLSAPERAAQGIQLNDYVGSYYNAASLSTMHVRVAGSGDDERLLLKCAGGPGEPWMAAREKKDSDDCDGGVASESGASRGVDGGDDCDEWDEIPVLAKDVLAGELSFLRSAAGDVEWLRCGTVLRRHPLAPLAT
jgi:hypothetical protein